MVGEKLSQSRIEFLRNYIGNWNNTVFGHGNPKPCLHHLKEEVEELIKEYDSYVTMTCINSNHPLPEQQEWADIWILLLAAMHKANVTTDQVMDWVDEKMKINETRTWQAPDSNGVVRHVKE